MAIRNRSRAALALFIFGGCFITPYPRPNGRVKSSVTRRAEMEAEDQTDILAKALAGGPPLRIGEKGLEFELGKGAEGSSVKWGLLKEKTPEVDQSAKAREQRAELRAKAARDLVNIDDEERERRRVASYAFAAFAALLALYLLWSNAPWYSRGALFPVVALAWGYNLSAKEGLCNIGQADLWDVDGTGMQKIEDKELARKLREKVNDFNKSSAALPASITVAFMALPELFRQVFG